MAKNIEMNWFNGSEYEVLYPYTTMEQILNLTSTIQGINNQISNNYDSLLNSINNKRITNQVISRVGTGGISNTVALTFTFVPILIFCIGLNSASTAGFWFNNYWSTFTGGNEVYMNYFRTSSSGFTVSWTYSISSSDSIGLRLKLNENGAGYIFIGIA